LSLLEPCDRSSYGQRLKDAAKKLGKSVRTVQRLVQKWEAEGLLALTGAERADKGKHRISQQWQDFKKHFKGKNFECQAVLRDEVFSLINSLNCAQIHSLTSWSYIIEALSKVQLNSA